MIFRAMIICGFDDAVDHKVNAILTQVKENEFTIEGEGLRLRQEMFTNFGKSDKIMIPVKVKKVKVSSKSRDSKVEVPVTIKKAKVDVNEYDEATSEGISMILPRHGRESINSIRML
jgi:predicted nuclease with TOPRIM domain